MHKNALTPRSKGPSRALNNLHKKLRPIANKGRKPPAIGIYIAAAGAAALVCGDPTRDCDTFCIHGFANSSQGFGDADKRPLSGGTAEPSRCPVALLAASLRRSPTWATNLVALPCGKVTWSAKAALAAELASAPASEALTAGGVPWFGAFSARVAVG